jgi:hypothetical protein
MKSSHKDLMRKLACGCLALLAAGPFTGGASRAGEHWLRTARLADLSPLTTEQRYDAFVNAQQTQDEQSPEQPAADDDVRAYDDQIDKSLHDRMTEFNDGRFLLPAISAPSIGTDKIGNGRTPEGFRAGVPALAQQLPESGAHRFDPNWTTAYWAAANTFSNPLYFQDRMLERHGHERFPKLQPMISGARFFGTVAALPYLMTLSHPCDCEYSLGYFRTGSAAPGLKQRPPWNRHAALVQLGVIAGVIIAFP